MDLSVEYGNLRLPHRMLIVYPKALQDGGGYYQLLKPVAPKLAQYYFCAVCGSRTPTVHTEGARQTPLWIVCQRAWGTWL